MVLETHTAGQVTASNSQPRVILRNPPGVLVIRGFKQLGGLLSADDGSCGKDFGGLTGFDESVGHFGFDGVHEKAAAHGAARGDGGVEVFNLDHRIPNGRAGVEDDVGEVLELLAIAVAAGAGFAVGGADDGGDLHPALLELLGHFDRHDVATAAGDDECAVAGLEIEVPQDAVRQTADVFEEHGLPLTIRSDDEVVKRQRELNDGIEAGEGAVARPHFLHQNAAVAGAKDVHHLSGEDRLCEHVGGLLDERKLIADTIEESLAGVEVLEGGSHLEFGFWSVESFMPAKPA